MAEVVQEKSRGLKFAERQLLRHGWEHGKGLGRTENGISEAIKVKVKCGKGGVGHNEGEQFTFHWWDHVFNKASSSLQVESDQSGIQLKKTVEEDEEDGMISNKKPRKAALARSKLYGRFVKSATLLSGKEEPDPKSSNSDDSSSSEEEDDQKLDLSSTTNLSDADLMKACGGRTAHKGARHGLTMSAKLARLEQQEAEFMAKYGKKSQTASPSPASQSADQKAEGQVKMNEVSQGKKMKKNRSTERVNEVNDEDIPESHDTDLKPKKKKKKASKDTEEISSTVPTVEGGISVNGEVEPSQKTKKKHKKKKKNSEQSGEESAASPAAETPEETSEVKKKKKKKGKSTNHHSAPADNDTESSQSEPVQDCVNNTKKKKSTVMVQDADVSAVESAVKQKRKKDKPVEESFNEEAVPPKKKKKRSKE